MNHTATSRADVREMALFPGQLPGFPPLGMAGFLIGKVIRLGLTNIALVKMTASYKIKDNSRCAPNVLIWLYC